MPLLAKFWKVFLICSLTIICMVYLTSRVQEERIWSMLKPITDAQIQLARNALKSIAERLNYSPAPLQIDKHLAPDENEEFDDSLNRTIPTWENLNKRYSHVLRGGRSKPTNPSNKIVIIIPYRDRRIHLKIFLDHMHPFLQRQNLEYVIYVVEMGQEGLFRRASLSNAGFLEVMKREETPCVIFHDVDMLPTNNKNLYFCTNSIRHYTSALQRRQYKILYKEYFGGVVAFPPNLFQKINGYANIYEGWGGEDDDLYRRIVGSRVPWTRQSESLGRYATLDHERQPILVNRQEFLKWSTKLRKIDGLNSINYTVDAIKERPLFTWILVNITKAVDTLTHIKPKYKITKKTA